MNEIVNITNEAETAYLAKYHSNLIGEGITTSVIAAMSFVEATEIAKELSGSEYHILSIEEIGLINIKKESLIRAGKWAKGLKDG